MAHVSGLEQTGQEGRRVHLGAHLRRVEEPSVPLGRGLAQPVDLVRFGGDDEHAGALPLDVEAESLDLGLHTVEVLQAHRRRAGRSRWATASFRSQRRASGSRRRSRRCAPTPPTRSGWPRSARCAGPDCVARRAVPSTDPVYPPPTTSRSHVIGPDSARVVRPRDVQPHRPEGACGERTFDQIRGRRGRRTPSPQLRPYGGRGRRHGFALAGAAEARVGGGGDRRLDCRVARVRARCPSPADRTRSRTGRATAARARTSRTIATYSCVCSFQML